MSVINPQTGTNVHEIAERIYRISTPVDLPDGTAFSFNQYLIDDDEPLLFHTGLRGLFPFVLEGVESVMPVTRLRHVAFSHVEADECGALNDWLAVAPHAAPLCGTIAAIVSVADLADRPPRALADGEALSLGHHTVRWIDAPHLPHGWECGFMMEERTGTMLSRRSVHATGPRAARAHRHRHPRAERSLPRRDGLFLAQQERGRVAGETRAPQSDHARLHAR